MIATQRHPLKLCEDRDALFPVQAFFNAIGDASLVDIITHLVKRQGYSSDYCHCRFPGDLDPAEPTFNGVRFSHFDDVVVIAEDQFADILDMVAASYSGVDPAGAVLIEKLASDFRDDINEPTHPRPKADQAND
jgi:CDI immunity protein